MERTGTSLPIAAVIGVAFATLLAPACTGAPTASGPVPVLVTPSQGTGIAPVDVVISGQRFDAAVKTDFEKGSASLDAGFRARLLPEAGGDPVALEAVQLNEKRQLEARVPSGIPRGAYALEVTAPTGQTGLLSQAFRVVTSAESVATFRVEPAETAVAGIPFLVSITAVDAAGLVVDGFAGEVQISDLTGTVSPTASGAFSFGRLSVRVMVTTLAAADRISVLDALGKTGTSTPFPIVPGPAVALAFSSAPATVVAGACSSGVSVELRDAAGHATAAAAVVDVQLQSAPAGSLAFFSDASCASPIGAVSIAAGASGATFHLRGSAAGPTVLRAVPAGLPSATQGATIAP